MEKRKEFPDRPWTIEEVAEYLQLSERTIEARIKDSGLPCIRVGGVRRFLREDVDRWLAAQGNGQSEKGAATERDADAPASTPAT